MLSKAALPLTAATLLTTALARAAEESDYYIITPIPTPEGMAVEVGGIEFLPDDKVAVSTRRGQIFTVDNVMGDVDPAEAEWTIYAEYLHEVLGLSWHDGYLYATQRPEVTRMKDEDGDGRADLFESFASGWGITGDYHEYAFGTRHDKDGNLYVVLCLTGSFSSNTLLRGWTVQVTPEGETVPFACGIRSPGGIGFNAEGDIFYTDNQGTWNGTSCLKHLAPGSFQGNPNGNAWFAKTDAIGEAPHYPVHQKDEGRVAANRELVETYVPPAILLPHGKMGQSPTGMAADLSGGDFGPFAGQLFVAEQTHSQVQRVFLEKVNGVYQGAAFPFLSGFKSGNIGIRMSEDGQLFTGGSNRGWGARGGAAYNFERVDWTGEVPFEVHEMRAKPDGFELTFTRPVDAEKAADAASYSMEAWTYIYQKGYGSPEVDKLTPELSVASVSDDGLSVRLVVDPMTEGHLHALKLDGLRSADDPEEPLLHPLGYYTLNEIPAE